MISVARTFDADLIRSIITEPGNYDHLTDDGSTAKEDYKPILNDNLYYLVMGDNRGIFFLLPTNYVSYDLHICMTQGCRGKEAVDLAKQAIQWAFDNTLCQKINTRIPSYNKKAHHFAVNIGFDHEGIDHKSYMKDGILYDQYILGLTRD